MFTLEQINQIHDRLGRAESLAQYVKALNALGVETYDSYIMDGHSEYIGNNGPIVSTTIKRSFAPYKGL